MSDLDEKLKEIRVNYRTWYSGSVCLLKHPHKGPCAGGSSEVGESAVGIPLDEDSIEQIKQVFKDAGYIKPTPLMQFREKNQMTGAYWYERFKGEADKIKINLDDDNSGYQQARVMQQLYVAAERASGIEK